MQRATGMAVPVTRRNYSKYLRASACLLAAILIGVIRFLTGPESVSRVVRKLRDKLLHLVQSENWPLTFSIGAVTFENPPDSVQQPIIAADRQMHNAKINGKNRIHYKVIEAFDGLNRLSPGAG
jgi:GGDEF domain-containing protein